ncbi:MAG: phosphate ABC transporter permease subunit PstC [Coriobacteriia bacterium]|nr:phosphate ABC transporter permease subunit PstC [Coriobacteriia bacterium]
MKELALKGIFFTCAFAFVLAVALIFIFVGWKAWPIVTDYGFGKFITGSVWSASKELYGILPLIVGSVIVTLGALALGTPLAVGTAVFLSEVASPKVRAVVRPAVELLAGVPSVVYGFFGIILVRAIVARFTGTLGFGAFTAWIVLGIMIVPTIAALSEDALRSIPEGIREASFAMGATRWQTIYKVVVPAAKIGIIDAIILGMGRAIGETMAVLMVVGNAPVFPQDIFSPLSTMTTQIVMDMPYAVGLHRTALFAMAAMLFVFSMLLVATVRLLSKLRD